MGQWIHFKNLQLLLNFYQSVQFQVGIKTDVFFYIYEGKSFAWTVKMFLFSIKLVIQEKVVVGCVLCLEFLTMVSYDFDLQHKHSCCRCSYSNCVPAKYGMCVLAVDV